MRRLIVISGAGLSAESGIRTFRTDEVSGKSLWDEYNLEEVCNVHGFNTGYTYRNDPFPPLAALSEETETSPSQNLYRLTHDFYNKRRVELQTVEPNAAHNAIADWHRRFPGKVINLTTNVDDLLERAGVDRDDVIHVHGYLPEVKIQEKEGGSKKTIDIGYSEINPDDHHWAKPNVVFFHENAPLYADLYDLIDSLTSQDLVIIVGCSNIVIDFDRLLYSPIMKGTKCIVVNPRISEADTTLYTSYGIAYFQTGAVSAFSNPNLVKVVEDHLEGLTCLQAKS